MQRVCLFSDVHADLRALHRVMRHATSLDIERFWCLGDFASGGPEPVAVFEQVFATCEVILAGNHEQFVTEAGKPGWVLRGGWADAARFARAQLGPPRAERLLRLPVHLSGPGVELVHASLIDPLYQYLNSQTVAEANFAAMESDSQIVLFGHTHAAAHWLQTCDQPPVASRQRVLLDARVELRGRVLLNPGHAADKRGARWCELELDERGTPIAATWRRVPADGESRNLDLT